MPSSFNQPRLKVPPSLIHRTNVLACGSTVFLEWARSLFTASWNGAQVVGKRLLVHPAAPGSRDVAQSVGTRNAKFPRLASLKALVVGAISPRSTPLILMR